MSQLVCRHELPAALSWQVEATRVQLHVHACRTAEPFKGKLHVHFRLRHQLRYVTVACMATLHVFLHVLYAYELKHDSSSGIIMVGHFNTVACRARGIPVTPGTCGDAWRMVAVAQRSSCATVHTCKWHTGCCHRPLLPLEDS
jgi:hypothetical protein